MCGASPIARSRFCCSGCAPRAPISPRCCGPFSRTKAITVSWLTIVPGKGRGTVGAHGARAPCRSRAIGLSSWMTPPHTGGTIFTACDIARRAGFASPQLKVLIPAHPAARDWHAPLADDVIVSLEPAQWHKRALLDPQVAEGRLDEYFRSQGFARVRVVASSQVEEMNARLQDASSDERGARLKRIFEVHLETPRGDREIRYVLAKSVGWGWLGYHAFLAGHRLSGFVPPILGQRDGILYMEWIPARHTGDRGSREAWIDTSASYVAARVRRLGLRSGIGIGGQSATAGCRRPVAGQRAQPGLWRLRDRHPDAAACRADAPAPAVPGSDPHRRQDAARRMGHGIARASQDRLRAPRHGQGGAERRRSRLRSGGHDSDP